MSAIKGFFKSLIQAVNAIMTIEGEIERLEAQQREIILRIEELHDMLLIVCPEYRQKKGG